MIKDQSSRGAKLVIGLIITAIIMASVGIGYIRFGGPLHRQNLLQDELLADILPPPAFVVEPYLHATWAIVDPGHADQALRALEQEQELFRQRKAYWATAPVPDELREEVSATIGTAEAFWSAIDNNFIPAMKVGNLDAMQQVHEAELTPAYLRQHAAVTHLVERSGGYRAGLMDRAALIVGVLLTTFALLAVTVLVLVNVTARRLRTHVVDPLVETAATMECLADGDFAVSCEGTERVDEIGKMARAIEVFRRNGLERAQGERDQQVVVAELSAGLDAMARQDLEFRIERAFPQAYEELRRNYNTAVDSLSGALRTVRVGSASVMNSIVEIRAASDDLALRNEQQALSLAQTTAAMNGVTGSVRETAVGARSVQDTIAATHAQASEGGEVVRRAVSAMAAIEGSAKEISQIVTVIDGIAFQTNLLALNAGVEAARAGESGRGFAVVATEVRALAQRSAEAAQMTKTLIETSSAQVGEGVTLVGETGERLIGIVDQVAVVDGLMRRIAQSAASQSETLERVNAAVADMDRMTQANAAMVEQSSAATHGLSLEAERLTELVSSFRTRETGKRPVHVADPASLRRSSALQAQRAAPGLALASG